MPGVSGELVIFGSKEAQREAGFSSGFYDDILGGMGGSLTNSYHRPGHFVSSSDGDHRSAAGALCMHRIRSGDGRVAEGRNRSEERGVGGGGGGGGGGWECGCD